MTTLHEESHRDVFVIDNVRRPVMKCGTEIVELTCTFCGAKTTGTFAEFDNMAWDWITGFFPSRKACCACCATERRGEWETLVAAAMDKRTAQIV
jgi:hypothetical protein